MFIVDENPDTAQVIDNYLEGLYTIMVEHQKQEANLLVRTAQKVKSKIQAL